MRSALAALAVLYVFLSLVYLWRRPGFFASVCVNSYPLAVFFGNGLGAILCLTGAMGALLIWFGSSKPPFRLVPGEIALAVWLAINALSLFVSGQIDLSGTVLMQLVGLGGSMYLIGRTYGNDDSFYSDVIFGSFIGVAICAPMLIELQLSAPVKDVIGGRLGAGANLTPVGLAAMVEIPLSGALAFVFFQRTPSSVRRLFVLALTVALLLPLAVALGTRSLILAAILILLTYIVIHVWHTRRLIAVAIPLIGTAVLGTLLFAVLIGSSSNSKLEVILMLGAQRLTENIGNTGVHLDASALERLHAYAQAWKLFLDAPLFGHGIGGFQYLADTTDHLYPHSMMLELLVSNGLVGTLIFFWWVTPLTFRAFVDAFHRPMNWISIAIFGELITALFRQQVSGSIGIAKLLFFILGIVAARYNLNRKNEHEPTLHQTTTPDLRVRNFGTVQSDGVRSSSLGFPADPARAGDG